MRMNVTTIFMMMRMCGHVFWVVLRSVMLRMATVMFAVMLMMFHFKSP
jgi:hypothetical protein